MKIYKASMDDIGKLIQLRIDFLKMDSGDIPAEDETAIRKQLEIYFKKHLNADDFVAMIAEMDGKILSTAFLIIQERPANPVFITGVAATLLNVMTYPKYRKKGIARQVVEKLIAYAKDKGVSSIDLLATKDGKTLYENLGFSVPSYLPMRLKLL